MNKRTFTWSLTGVAAVLGFMLTVQISSRPQSSNTDMSSYLDLRTQVQEQVQENQSLKAEIARQNQVLWQYQDSAGETSKMKDALKQDAKVVEEAAGRTKVSGPGITLKIQYNPNVPHVDEYQGLFDVNSDAYISEVVNYLFANGAKAISINGQRLVTTSSIRLVKGLDQYAGVLQVNTVPVMAPYVITAVGDVDKMTAVLTVEDIVGQFNQMWEDCIITEHRGSNGVTVPAYDGPLPGRWAKEVNNG